MASWRERDGTDILFPLAFTRRQPGREYQTKSRFNSEPRHCTGSPISVRDGRDTNPFRSPPVVLSHGLIISDGKTPRLWLPNQGWRYRRWWTRPAGFSFPIWVSLVRRCLVTPTCLFCCLYRLLMKDLNAGPLGERIFSGEPSLGIFASDTACVSSARAVSVHYAVGKVLDGPNVLACRVAQIFL